MEVVYIDVLAVLNLGLDFLLLVMTARLAGVFARRVRLLLGALLGALYAVLTAFPLPLLLTWFPVKLAVGFLMVLLAFGKSEALWRLYALFLAISCAFAGLTAALTFLTGTPLGEGGVYYLDVPLRVVLGACVLAYVMAGLLFRGTAKHGFVHKTTECVTLSAFGHTESFSLLLDSGCDLTDPASGRPVLVLERQAVARLLPAELRFLLPALAMGGAAEALPRIPEDHRQMFRLLPFSAIGTAGGLLLMFKPAAAVREDGKTFETYVAISPHRIANGRYEGLIGV